MHDISILRLPYDLSSALARNAPVHAADIQSSMRVEDTTDSALAAAYLGGDEHALERLIERYLPAIYRFTFRMLGHDHDAQDATQETFVKVWKHIGRYRMSESFKAWIFRIARNTAIDMIRKRKGFAFADFETESGENMILETFADDDPLPEELAIKTENGTLVEKLLEQIPPQSREVLLLRYNEDMTFDEIGRVLEKPLDTVKSQHRRALARLRTLLENAPN